MFQDSDSNPGDSDSHYADSSLTTGHVSRPATLDRPTVRFSAQTTHLPIDSLRHGRGGGSVRRNLVEIYHVTCLFS